MSSRWCLVIGLVTVLLLISASVSSSSSSSRVHPDLVFDSDYSIHEAPVVEQDQPLLVNFSINLRNVLGVNEKEQLISLETSLRMFWRDPRVRLNPAALERDGSSSSKRDYITLNPRVSKIRPPPF